MVAKKKPSTAALQRPPPRGRRPRAAAKRSLAAPTRAQPAVLPTTSGAANFPIVGMGASAGGLEALQEFFTHMPADSGIAFVVVTHQ